MNSVTSVWCVEGDSSGVMVEKIVSDEEYQGENVKRWHSRRRWSRFVGKERSVSTA